MEDQIPLILSVFSLILFHSANAVCVPRTQSDFKVLDQPPVKIDSSTVFAASSTVFPSPSSEAPRSQPTQWQASSPHASPKQSPAPAESASSHISGPSGSIGSPTGSISEPVHSLLDAVIGEDSDPKVQKICEQTDYPSLCFSSLAPIFDGKTDPLSVAELLIKTVSQHTEVAIGMVSKMASAPGLDKKTSSAFSDCKEMYDEALDNFQEALDAIPNADIGTIQTMLSDAIDDYATCDDGFTGQPDPEPQGVSPMAAIGEDLMNMTDNILAIVNSIP